MSDRERAIEEFRKYFAKNYPGPDTIIHKPDWHAPKLFRAVEAAMREAGYVLVPVEPTKEMCIAGGSAVEDNIDEGQDSYTTYKIYDEMQLATAAYRAMLSAHTDSQ